MTCETRMSLAEAGRKRQTVQTGDCTSWQSVPKMEAATGNERLDYRRPAVDNLTDGTAGRIAVA